ncbi:acetyl-CoA acetyltransferase, cytosolic [Hyalella azteca]|uniref:Acetyl-CoA acetyltransferase, cytosolic n=1 Tax=Hyalella azteca TaxID=294128 RepID=A0A8B7PPR0_HYAAZ|nr:acetyl-CoA acetyltransferase, cytosolic [Hyalella azteca]
MSDKVVILSAVRTPIGSFNGSLSTVPAHKLGAAVMKEAISRAGVTPDSVSEVIMGQVLTAGCGQNPARQAAMDAGVPFPAPATCINMLCGSGLRSVVLGYQSLRCGDASVVVCGGQESMSQAPHALLLRSGVKMGNATMIDTMNHDGLTDAFLDYHMGVTAENVAKRWGISRDQQDKYACESQRRASHAQRSGHFSAELIPVPVPSRRGGDDMLVMADEYPRPNTTMETLTKLKPCFVTDGTGTVTAGNSSGVNDGAACLVLTTADKATTAPLATIRSWAQAGIEPAYMGVGPVPAIREALNKAGWSVEDVELWELNEAFAAQSVAVTQMLDVDSAIVNVSGGAIALGHPIGSSGSRVLVTLLHGLKRLEKRKGVAALCVGGGMGIAICVEREV